MWVPAVVVVALPLVLLVRLLRVPLRCQEQQVAAAGEGRGQVGDSIVHQAVVLVRQGAVGNVRARPVTVPRQPLGHGLPFAACCHQSLQGVHSKAMRQ